MAHYGKRTGTNRPTTGVGGGVKRRKGRLVWGALHITGGNWIESGHGRLTALMVSMTMKIADRRAVSY